MVESRHFQLTDPRNYIPTPNSAATPNIFISGLDSDSNYDVDFNNFS